MNPYYESRKDKFKKDMRGFLKHISKELKEETGRDFDDLLEEIWLSYEKEFLENFPYIGGDKSSGTRNLTGAYMFVAMGEVCRKNYGMSLEKWGFLTTICYRRYFEQIPAPLFKMAGKLIKNSKLINKMLLKKDMKNSSNAEENPGSFVTKVQTPTEEYPAVYYTLSCPLSDFAKNYGYMEYMPYICNLDYVTFEIMGVPFYRENTCAAGDGFCDFKLKANAPVNSSWPCHILTPGDPLK